MLSYKAVSLVCKASSYVALVTKAIFLLTKKYKRRFLLAPTIFVQVERVTVQKLPFIVEVATPLKLKNHRSWLLNLMPCAKLTKVA